MSQNGMYPPTICVLSCHVTVMLSSQYDIWHTMILRCCCVHQSVTPVHPRTKLSFYFVQFCHGFHSRCSLTCYVHETLLRTVLDQKNAPFNNSGSLLSPQRLLAQDSHSHWHNMKCSNLPTFCHTQCSIIGNEAFF